MSPRSPFRESLKTNISLLWTDLRPPGKSRWWKRSRSSTSPARLRTAETDHRSLHLERKHTNKISDRAHRNLKSTWILPACVSNSPRWRIAAWTESCRTGRVWQRWCAGSWWGWEPTGSPENLSPDAPTRWPEEEEEEWVRTNLPVDWSGSFSQGSGFSQLKSRRDGRWRESCSHSHTSANLK